MGSIANPIIASGHLACEGFVEILRAVLEGEVVGRTLPHREGVELAGIKVFGGSRAQQLSDRLCAVGFAKAASGGSWGKPRTE